MDHGDDHQVNHSEHIHKPGANGHHHLHTQLVPPGRGFQKMLSEQYTSGIDKNVVKKWVN